MSRRARANKSITSRISQSASIISRLRKQTVDPHLGTSTVSGSNISDGTVDSGNLSGDAVDDKALGRGVVGTENLGVVNRMTSDSAFTVNLPGALQLDGPQYPALPAGTSRPMVMDGQNLVRGQSVYTATVDPLWTVGLPYVTLSTGATVPTTGWSADMGTPTPGQSVKVVHDGAGGWHIVSGIVAGDGFLNTIRLAPYFQTPWVEYDTNWKEASATKTSDGIVMLSGLFKQMTTTISTNTLVLTLPPGFRPDAVVTFPVMGINTSYMRISVRPSGEVWWLYTGTPLTAGSYTTLNGVTYPAAGVATWTNVAPAGTPTVAAFAPGWSSAILGSGDVATPPVSYWIDPYGIAWWRGLATCSTAVTADNTVMVNFNSQPLKPTLEHHYPAAGTGAEFRGVGTNLGSNALRFKATGTMPIGSVVELASVTIATVASDTLLTWIVAAYTNGWVTLGGGFPAAQVADRNGVIYYKGLVANGPLNAAAFTLSVGLRSKGYYATNGGVTGYSGIFCRIANLAPARLDTGGTGAVIPASGSNAWFSIDGMMSPKEQ